jgi:hypothetical protein
MTMKIQPENPCLHFLYKANACTAQLEHLPGEPLSSRRPAHQAPFHEVFPDRTFADEQLLPTTAPISTVTSRQVPRLEPSDRAEIEQFSVPAQVRNFLALAKDDEDTKMFLTTAFLSPAVARRAEKEILGVGLGHGLRNGNQAPSPRVQQSAGLHFRVGSALVEIHGNFPVSKEREEQRSGLEVSNKEKQILHRIVKMSSESSFPSGF